LLELHRHRRAKPFQDPRICPKLAVVDLLVNAVFYLHHPPFEALPIFLFSPPCCTLLSARLVY